MSSFPSSSALLQSPPPIKFGTDGWRGIIAADFTFERLVQVAPIAAQVLAETYGKTADQRLVVVGYDRRFLSEQFAQAAAEAVCSAGFDVLLAQTYASTPAFSWAVKQHQALGALVITASHNPGIYSGLKVKGAFGGSVMSDVTHRIQMALAESNPIPIPSSPGQIRAFDPWPDYCRVLGAKVNLERIQAAIAQGKVMIFVDPMHGAAAGGLSQILGPEVQELRGNRDPLFGGGSPEPLPQYLNQLTQAIQAQRTQTSADPVIVGFVFDGDGDRIAAMDGQGQFLSSQVLIPILIDHLAARRGMTGEVIKTISSSDLIPRVAALHQLPVHETSIGYKYVAERMLQLNAVLLGGEESGGIGYGDHIPERDGLLSALYLLEAIAESGQDLSDLYRQLQIQTNFTCAYDRIDLPLASEADQVRLIEQLQTQPFTQILNVEVAQVQTGDGFKFHLRDQSWLLVRFSGTEPVLRLYCEAATRDRVMQVLDWAKDWAHH